MARLNRVFEGHKAPRRVWPDPSTYPRLPPMDPPIVQVVADPVLERGMPAGVQLRLLADAYRAGVQAVYGFQSHAFTRGCVDDSTLTPTLRAGAKALLEHGISPAVWVRWRMTHLKDWEPMKDGRKPFEKKPPRPVQLFSAKSINKRANWCISESDGPSKRCVFTQAHHEQMLRRDEAVARWRGWVSDPLLGMPKWYTAMRREEMSWGSEFTDPLTLYTRLPAHLRQAKYNAKGEPPASQRSRASELAEEAARARRA